MDAQYICAINISGGQLEKRMSRCLNLSILLKKKSENHLSGECTQHIAIH